MATIVTRAGKGSPLTHTEMDANFTNLNTSKVEDVDSRALTQPSLLLDFTTDLLDPRVTFTRASTATYTDKFGVLRTAAANTPRFDYDPVTGKPNGLLIEDSRTNLLTYSSQFDNAAWSNDNVSISPNNIICPDGTQSSALITASSSTYWRIRKSGLSGITSTNVCISVFVKKGNADVIGMNIDGNAIINYTFSSNTFTSIGSSVVSYSSTLVGNGWVRIAAVINSPAWTPAPIRLINLNDYCYIWGAQLEVGSFLTSYIPTTSSTVTRAIDVADVTGTNFSSWYRADESTFYADVSISGRPTGHTNKIIGLYLTLGNGLVMYNNATETSSINIYDDVSSIQSGGTSFIGQFLRVASTYSSSGMAIIKTGGTIATTSTYSTRFATAYAMSIGQGWNGWIKRIAYYPKRLTNTELQALTQV